jgi:hypothetical protein
MNLIDMRIFFNTTYSVSKNCTFLSEIQILHGFRLGSDHLALGRDVCVNFIKTIFQILRNAKSEYFLQILQHEILSESSSKHEKSALY